MSNPKTKNTKSATRFTENETWNDVLEELPIGICRSDLKGTLKYMNKHFEKVTGYTRDESVGRNVLKLGLVSDDMRSYILKRIAARIGGAPPKKLETQFKCKDGSWIWVSLKDAIVRKSGVPVGFQIVASDITERKRAEEELKESEERYRAVVENSHSGIFIVKEDYKFNYINDALCNIVGRRREDIIGHDFREFLDKDSKSLVADLYLRRQRGEEVPPRYEFNVVKKNGEKRRVEISSSIVKDSRGRAITIGQILDITERKQAEEALRESDRRQSTLISNLPGFVYRCANDPDWTMIYISDGCRSITGYDSADFIGNRTLCFNDIVQEEYREPLWQKWQDVLKAKRHFEEEYPIITARGETRWVWERGQGIFASDGQQLFLEGFITDITERRQAEKNLANREAELRSLLNGLNDSVYAVDTDFRYIFVNDAHLSHMVDSGHISQKRSEKIIGKRYQDFHPEKESNEFIENIRKVCKTGKSIQYEFKWPGIERWSSRVLSPIYELETGIVNNVSVISRDITERKQKEDALKENEERYRQIFQFSPDSIIIHDMDMNILDANNKAIEEFGYSKTELLKKTIFELHPETELKHSAQVLVAMNNKELLNVETKFVRKDGSVFFAEATPCKYTLGSKPVIHVVIRDITEQMQLEAEKQQLESKFRESQKMESIGNLAGGIAHDFNNLLTVIQGNAQIAMMAMDESNPQYKNLTQIMNSSTRAASLTRQLLLFSRKQTVELKTLELNQTIQNLLKMLQRLIGENIIIETELATDLSNIEADEGNIEQVIMNLAVNARDAMPDGGKLTIITENISIPDDEQSHVQDSQAGDFVRISVQDTGCGIPKELLSKIFEPFFSTKEKGKGTGLGLSVVYGIVKNHNGWINAYSEPQQGTAFKIYLPVSVSLLQEENTIKTESAESLHGNGEQILVIEDEQGILDFASSALRQFGYTIRVASNGHQALSVFEEAKGNFQLIISDVILPDINGFDLVTKLTKEYPDIPVIMCSGYTEERVKQSIIKEKGFRFLQKPYSMNALLEMVKKDIRKSGQ